MAFVSRRADGAPYPIKFKLSDLNLTNSRGYSVTVSKFFEFSNIPMELLIIFENLQDLYDNNKTVGQFKPTSVFETRINPNGKWCGKGIINYILNYFSFVFFSGVTFYKFTALQSGRK